MAAVAQRGRNSATACCVLCGIRIVRYAALLWKQLKSDKRCCPAENDQRQEELLIPKKILCIGVRNGSDVSMRCAGFEYTAMNE